jgi:hypothetical protein
MVSDHIGGHDPHEDWGSPAIPSSQFAHLLLETQRLLQGRQVVVLKPLITAHACTAWHLLVNLRCCC